MFIILSWHHYCLLSHDKEVSKTLCENFLPLFRCTYKEMIISLPYKLVNWWLKIYLCLYITQNEMSAKQVIPMSPHLLFKQGLSWNVHMEIKRMVLFWLDKPRATWRELFFGCIQREHKSFGCKLQKPRTDVKLRCSGNKMKMSSFTFLFDGHILFVFFWALEWIGRIQFR